MKNLSLGCPQEKVPKILVNRQRTPEKQKESPTLWNWGYQGSLVIKTSGNSADFESIRVKNWRFSSSSRSWRKIQAIPCYQHRPFWKIVAWVLFMIDTFFEWEIAEVDCFPHRTEYCIKKWGKHRVKPKKSYEYRIFFKCLLNFLIIISLKLLNIPKISGHLWKGLVFGFHCTKTQLSPEQGRKHSTLPLLG